MMPSKNESTNPYVEAAPVTIEITLDPRFGVELQEAAVAVDLTPAEWAQLAVEGSIRLFALLGGQPEAKRIAEIREARGGKRVWDKS